MKKTVLIATVMALVIAAAGLVLGGCGKKSSGDVAATVRGEKLMESTVTDYIQDYRASNALEGDEDWANYLYINGYTPETLRENVIEYFADRMAVQQAAKSNGVQISDDEVREGIAQMRAQYGYTDDASWDLALQNMGFTADQFAEEMRYTMLEEALLDKAVPKVAASQEQLEEMAATYGAGYAGKRSSHILVADEASAQAILSRLQPQVENPNFAETFASEAKANSIDTGSAATGGDVGWDCITPFVAPYQEALDKLEPGQLSGVVKSNYGYHIIYCTEEFKVEDDQAVSVQDMPESIRAQFEVDVNEYLYDQAKNAYLDQLKSNYELVVNDMPKGLPYDVDMSLAATPSTSE